MDANIMAQFLRSTDEKQPISLPSLTVFSFHKRLAACRLSTELHLSPVDS